MPSSMLRDAVDQSGTVSPNVVSGRLKVTRDELASALGLSRDAITKKNRLAAVATQKRLHEVIEILDRAAPWAGSELAAFAWYRSQPLPSFGDQTAEDLVKAGLAATVTCYLERIAVGGFA